MCVCVCAPECPHSGLRVCDRLRLCVPQSWPVVLCQCVVRVRVRVPSRACLPAWLLLPNCREIVLLWCCSAATRCCGSVDMHGLGSGFAKRLPKTRRTTRGHGHGYKDTEHEAYNGGKERPANCQSNLRNLNQVLHPAQGPSGDLYMTSHRLPAPSPHGGRRYC